MLVRRALLVVLTVGLVLAGCDTEPAIAPGEGALEEGPRGADDIVQHLIEAPEYPAPVSADAELAELRNAEGTNRHQAFVAELGSSGTLEGALVRGSLVLVDVDVTLAVVDGASVATLEGDEVVAVTTCEAACDVVGRALVAPAGWLDGIGVAAGWELLVPAPID